MHKYFYGNICILYMHIMCVNVCECVYFSSKMCALSMSV